MFDNIETCFFGGYDKIQTLNYIDKLNNEVCLLEYALDDKKSGKKYNVPTETKIVTIKSELFGGFNKHDIDAYISELRKMIHELRVQLTL